MIESITIGGGLITILFVVVLVLAGAWLIRHF